MDEEKVIRDRETGEELSLIEIRIEYAILKGLGETEAETFEDYLTNITDPNGTCEWMDEPLHKCEWCGEMFGESELREEKDLGLLCDFLLNKDFKKNAKYYLCLFSASWCGPCRAEMPRIAKTYAESLKDDPNIELIHFSRDREEDKALAWAKEHNVKFPVVKYNGGNPLDLHTRGIPHLFIVKADGTLMEEGHPMKLFTDEKLRELKSE